MNKGGYSWTNCKLRRSIQQSVKKNSVTEFAKFRRRHLIWIKKWCTSEVLNMVIKDRERFACVWRQYIAYLKAVRCRNWSPIPKSTRHRFAIPVSGIVQLQIRIINRQIDSKWTVTSTVTSTVTRMLPVSTRFRRDSWCQTYRRDPRRGRSIIRSESNPNLASMLARYQPLT